MKRSPVNPISAGDNKGFTLIEAVIALAILSIGLLAVMAMQFSASTSVRRSAVNSRSVAYGSEILEKLMQYSYNDLTSGTVVANPGNESSSVAEGAIYRADWTISAPGTPAPNTVTVTVTVTNPDGQTLTLSSVKANMNL